MQRSLLPRESPTSPGSSSAPSTSPPRGWTWAATSTTSSSSTDGRLAVVLGDVTGHGIDAAADMAMAKFVFRSLAREHPEPADFLASANEVVCDEIAPGKFITMLYLVVDARDGELACASAGHPRPRLVPRTATCGDRRRGLALGHRAAASSYDEAREPLPPGAALVLYTDGVIEARRDGELYGSERLDALLAARPRLPAAELAGRCSTAAARSRGGELADDCAVVVIKRAGIVAAATRRRPPRRRGRSSRALSALVFGAGTGSLAAEICASRLLAPYYGSSTIVWANLIGLVLPRSRSATGWAGGSPTGGRAAPARRHRRRRGRLVAADPVRDARRSSTWRRRAWTRSRPARSSAPSSPRCSSSRRRSLLLGMVAPFAIRLALADVGAAGAVAGRLYALSTAGSLLGTFLSALVLIPLIGTQRTLLVCAARARALAARRCSAPAGSLAVARARRRCSPCRRAR